VPRTVQIRDLDDDVYRALAQQAADAGLSVPELLTREAIRLASRSSMSQWLNRVTMRPQQTGAFDSVAALDEIRGPWPEASTTGESDRAGGRCCADSTLNAYLDHV
jgi:plasmid stability protein